jgi:hypothetical protein
MYAHIVGSVQIADTVAQAAEVGKGKSLWLSLSEGRVFPCCPSR